MGLDVYAGPLTRYYAGHWKTITQQAGEASGMEVNIVYAGGQPDRPDLETARRAVIDWQRALKETTGIAELAWTESADADYFTDKPDWDGYWAVVFLAASDEFPDVPPPAEIPPPSRLPDPTKQPLWRRMEPAYYPKPASGLRRLFGGRDPEPPAGLRYPNLIGQQELWLPADFERPFTAVDAFGNPATIGSAPWLLRELEGLNARTLRADEATLDEWSHRGPAQEDVSLRRVAEYGLAVFLRAARFAVDRRVPLKLDY